jgi:predicted DNA-binding transcriptional regulator YafY
MNRSERLEKIRLLMRDNTQLTLPEIAKATNVSLRTTYRDVNDFLSLPAGTIGQSLVRRILPPRSTAGRHAPVAGIYR